MPVILDDLAIDSWPLGVGVLIMVLVMRGRRQHDSAKLICWAVFGVYLLFVVDKAFFPIHLSGAYAESMRTFGRFSSFVNLVPFNFNFAELPELVYLQIFQNILLTVPFGFGVNFVAPVKAKDYLWLVPAVGLGLEAGQLALSWLLGYPHRVIDINDAILNAAGVVIGYCLFRVFAGFYVGVTQRLGLKHRGLTAYIYEIAGRATLTGKSLSIRMN